VVELPEDMIEEILRSRALSLQELARMSVTSKLFRRVYQDQVEASSIRKFGSKYMWKGLERFRFAYPIFLNDLKEATCVYFDDLSAKVGMRACLLFNDVTMDKAVQ
jgi:hypothetical protein